MTAERLKIARQSLGYSQNQFSKLLNIAQSTYVKYELGGGIPEKVLIVLIEKGIDLNWLFTDEGNMLLSDATPVSYTPVKKDDEYIMATGKTYPVSIPDGGLSIPILASKVSAGPGEE